MVDRLTKEHRSWNMSQIRGKDTKPEVVVRSMLHNLGFRFRLHRKDLPGRPDVVLSKHSTVVFVNGCYWHRHPGCQYAYTPKSRVKFWTKKFNETVERDKRNRRELKKLGWRVVTIWECEIRKPERLQRKLKKLVAAPKKATKRAGERSV